GARIVGDAGARPEPVAGVGAVGAARGGHEVHVDLGGAHDVVDVLGAVGEGDGGEVALVVAAAAAVGAVGGVGVGGAGGGGGEGEGAGHLLDVGLVGDELGPAAAEHL